ncbi:MAG: hypothetical protein ABIR19_10515 [Ginsengibacter sp.]
MKLLIVFIILCGFICSCGPSRKVLDARENALFNQWLNHPKSQLVGQWGIPDSTRTDGRNGEVLIYKEAVDFISVMNENYTGPQYSFRKEMYVNSDSLIYYWKAWRRK